MYDDGRVVKVVEFESVYETRLRLYREVDGEVWFEIFEANGEKVKADTCLNVEEMIEKLKEVSQ